MNSTLDSRLARYINNEKKAGTAFEAYTLDGITEALKHVGNPQRAFRSIHVAGTNGKGSVCTMIAAILSRSGYKTGLYTSPHLVSICERISVDGTMITNESLCSMIDLIEMSINGKDIGLTYFDILTAAAFLQYSNSFADAAVIETGLGGRLDSTNVIIPELSIITDISLDHRQILGDTIELIAAEKAGIIKTRKPCVTTNSDFAALAILEQHADAAKSPLFVYGKDFTAENIAHTERGIRFDYRDNAGVLRNIELSQRGSFQAKNCAAALQSIRLLEKTFPSVSETMIRDALKNTVVPGRMQTLCNDPLMLFDPAHNRQALGSLCDTLYELFPNREIVMFITCMADKEPEALTELLAAKKIRNVFYCTLDDERAYQPSAGLYRKTFACSNPESIADCIRETHNAVTVFTGSFRLYATATAVRLLLDSGKK